MSETTDWNSGQGAYPQDRDTWTLTMQECDDTRRVVKPLAPKVTRHLSALPTREEIRSLCDDEMGDIEREVRVIWFLEHPNGTETDDIITLKPTGGAA